MADQLGISRTLTQPVMPDFGLIPPILPDLSDQELLEAKIKRLEQRMDVLLDYIRQQQQTLDFANDLVNQRLNEFLVERQETETTIAQWTANQNNLDLGNGGGIAFRFSTDASRDITGLLAGIDGQIVRFINVGSNDGVFKNQDANSDAANRFLNDTGADITVSANEQILFWRDNTTTRWRGFSQTWT